MIPRTWQNWVILGKKMVYLNRNSQYFLSDYHVPDASLRLALIILGTTF